MHLLQGCLRILRNYSGGQHGHFRSVSTSMGNSEDRTHDCGTSSGCANIAVSDEDVFGINPYRKWGPHLKYQSCAIDALPTVTMHINGKKHTVLVDTGCT